MAAYKVVMVRHGESVWNKENLFTGWTDVDLSDTGHAEAQKCAEVLQREGYTFDVAYTSVLKRAIRTLWYILDGLDLMWIPVHNHWRLNERHYGALQGLNKAETAEKYGDDQVKIWRRSYDTQPPALKQDDDRFPAKDPRYQSIPPADLPKTECLKDTVARVLPYWDDTIAPAIRSGTKVIIAAHGNSLRALVQHLDGLSPEEIMQLNIPTGVPLVYEFDDQMQPIKHYYLGDADQIAAAQAAVAAQGSAKKPQKAPEMAAVPA